MLFETGLNVINFEYTGDEKAESIIGYYNKKATKIACQFENVSPGDIISCDINQVGYKSFKAKTTFAINYKSGNCIGRIRTDCNRQIIGESISYCNNLVVNSYIDGKNAFCDQNVWEIQQSSQANNALLFGERILDDPLEVFEELDPYIQWTLIGIMITFVILVIISIYICGFKGKKYEQEEVEQDVIAQEIAMTKAMDNELEMKKALSGDDQLMVAAPNVTLSNNDISDSDDDTDPGLPISPAGMTENGTEDGDTVDFMIDGMKLPLKSEEDERVVHV